MTDDAVDRRTKVALAIRDLHFSYPGEGLGFRSLSLEVFEGEVFGILGPSGAGKSTLLRLIGGHLFPAAGTVEIAGVPVTHVPPEARPSATVFQRYALFPHLTVEENIRFGIEFGTRRLRGPAVSEEVDDLIEELGLLRVRSSLPNGISGGQMQRVALARALATRPALLLLDEPYSALDPRARAAARNLIAEVQQRHSVTILAVSHDQDDVLAASDRVAIFDDFRCLQVGEPSTLIERPASQAVADYIQGFLEITLNGRPPFYCHRSLIEVVPATGRRDIEEGIRTQGRVVRVSRRLDQFLSVIRLDGFGMEIEVPRGGDDRLLPDPEVDVIFKQRICFS